MDAPFSPRYADFFPRLADVATVADAAVADHSRSLDGESFVIDPRANRDDANMMGHRPTECDTTNAYVHWHDPSTATVVPFEDSPLGRAA